MKVVALAAVVAAGCYSPSYRDCEVTCTEGLCPTGFACMGGVCRAPGMTGPCGGGGGGDDAAMQLDDATADAPPPTWGPARRVAAGNTDLRDPTLTGDLLHLYASNDAGSILYASRTSQADTFGSPIPVPNLDTTAFEDGPDVSADHARMFFVRETASLRDIHQTARDPAANRWETGTAITELDTGNNSANPHVTPDDTMIVFEKDLQPALYIAKRNAPAIAWEPPMGLAQLADANVARSPALSADKLTLYYVARDGIDTDIFEARRSSVTASFTTAQLVTGDVNTGADENDPWISPDGNTLVFVRREPNGIMAIFEAKRL